MAKKRRDTLTTQFLHGSPPDGNVSIGMPGTPPDGRMPIPRLGYFGTDSMPYDAEVMAERIRSASVNSFSKKQTLFVCDTNVFVQDVGEVIWNALLDAKVLMLPPVWSELNNVWMTSPRHDTKVRRILKQDFENQESQDNQFVFFQLPQDDKEIIAAAEYYINLLALRKRALDFVSAKFFTDNGRDPSPAELQRIANIRCGERGYQLASRSQRAGPRPFPFADEELIVTAVFAAIFTKNEVVILTRDAGVQEQFYKFLWLLDTHYRSMLLAEEVGKHPDQFQAQSLCKSDCRADPGFADEGRILLIRDGETPYNVLPEVYEPMPIYCWLIGDSGGDNSMSMLNFCAEDGFQDIIRMKGRTGGRSTDLFGSKNCHIYLFPLSFDPLGSFAIIANDKMTRIGDCVPVAWLDLHLALFQGERFRRIVDLDEVPT